MATRPDKTKRTRTPRRKQRHNKLNMVTVKPKTLESAFRYDPDTGLIFERYQIHTTPKTKKGDPWMPTDVTNYETPFPAGRLDKDGYIVIQWRGQSFPAHRLAYYLGMGKWPDFYIRHNNGLRFDNRLCNLVRAGAKPIAKPNGAEISY